MYQHTIKIKYSNARANVPQELLPNELIPTIKNNTVISVFHKPNTISNTKDLFFLRTLIITITRDTNIWSIHNSANTATKSDKTAPNTLNNARKDSLS